MSSAISRRDALRSLGAAGAAAMLRGGRGEAQDSAIRVAGVPVEVAIAVSGEHSVRVSVIPIENGRPKPIPLDGSLARPSAAAAAPVAQIVSLSATGKRVRCGAFTVSVAAPLTVRVEAADGRLVQQLQIDGGTGACRFPIGGAPLLGLGQGGPQFDRRGSTDQMRSGQGGYRLRTHGGRMPVQWLVGTAGWAMFIHHPLGTFDFSGPEGRFDPGPAGLPLDLFIVNANDATGARQPARVMAEYARLTGHPEMPPLWSLGYQQSHRTLAGRDEIIGVARTFREKKLPCDALIYLGTGFTPSGWNATNGSFAFNQRLRRSAKGHRRAARPGLQGRAARGHPGSRAARDRDRRVRPRAIRRGGGRLLLERAPQGLRARRGRLVAR
jgi:alpha-glucosidase/alpha-D-xyloside xylohydrolase